MEEFCVQRGFVALAREIGTKEASKTFAQVFFKGTSPFESKEATKRVVLAHHNGSLGRLIVMMLWAKILLPNQVDDQ